MIKYAAKIEKMFEYAAICLNFSEPETYTSCPISKKSSIYTKFSDTFSWAWKNLVQVCCKINFFPRMQYLPDFRNETTLLMIIFRYVPLNTYAD